MYVGSPQNTGFLSKTNCTVTHNKFLRFLVSRDQITTIIIAGVCRQRRTQVATVLLPLVICSDVRDMCTYATIWPGRVLIIHVLCIP